MTATVAIPQGCLYVVAVPIGNLEDITLRAVRCLQEVETVLCEDTRTTRKLFNLLGIEQRSLLSLHDHNEMSRLDAIVAKLARGENLALVSDAGTPLVSDPGGRLVPELIERGVRVVPIPGASAVLAALCGSGLDTSSFLFLGFPPVKAGQLKQFLQNQRETRHTQVYFVGPHHLSRFLAAAKSVFGLKRRVSIGRELTKRFEEFIRGTLGTIEDELKVVRGEVVVLISGEVEVTAATASEIDACVLAHLKSGLKPSQAARLTAKALGCTRDDAYQSALKQRLGTH